MSRSTRTTRDRSSTGRSSGGNRLVLVLVGVAVIAFVGVVAFLSANETADLVSIEDVAGTVSVEGAPLVPYPEEATAPDPAVGLPSPVAEVLDYDDRPVTLGAPGRPQVLVFLAHWCPACNAELPLLRDVIDTGLVTDEFDFVLITTGLNPARPNWPPKRWLEDAGLGGVMTVRDDGLDTLMRTYGMRAYPSWVVLDDTGTVVARRQGQLTTRRIAELLDLASP